MMLSNTSVVKGSGTRRHAKYPEQIAEYAAFHDVHKTTIGSWIRRGKEVGQLPPLRCPGLMARWKRRWYGTRIQARYTKSYSEYAAIFDTTTRSIKRWVRRGKLVRSLPPLDNA